jgi:hypothetical protein
MRKRYLYFAVLILALVGLISTIILVASEIALGGVCPKVTGIPLCYVVLLLISAVIVSHLKILRDKNTVFFIAAFFGLMIAVIMSILQFNDCAQCPKAFEIIPMCYLSVILFGGLIGLKIWEVRQ